MFYLNLRVRHSLAGTLLSGIWSQEAVCKTPHPTPGPRASLLGFLGLSDRKGNLVLECSSVNLQEITELLVTLLLPFTGEFTKLYQDSEHYSTVQTFANLTLSIGSEVR